MNELSDEKFIDEKTMKMSETKADENKMKNFFSNLETSTEVSKLEELKSKDKAEQWWKSLEKDNTTIRGSQVEVELEEKAPQGGAYSEVRKGADVSQEVHHMPADSISPLNRGDAPSVSMDKADHRETASCGNSKEAQEYRNTQKDLIEQGNFRGALQMDIKDLRDKFGDKYEAQIAECLQYVDKLDKKGEI